MDNDDDKTDFDLMQSISFFCERRRARSFGQEVENPRPSFSTDDGSNVTIGFAMMMEAMKVVGPRRLNVCINLLPFSSGSKDQIHRG